MLGWCWKAPPTSQSRSRVRRASAGYAKPRPDRPVGGVFSTSLRAAAAASRRHVICGVRSTRAAIRARSRVVDGRPSRIAGVLLTMLGCVRCTGVSTVRPIRSCAGPTTGSGGSRREKAGRENSLAGSTAFGMAWSLERAARRQRVPSTWPRLTDCSAGQMTDPCTKPLRRQAMLEARANPLWKRLGRTDAIEILFARHQRNCKFCRTHGWDE